MKRKRKSKVVVEQVSKEWEAHLEEVFKEAFSTPDLYQAPKEYVYLTKADFGYKIGRTTDPTRRPLTVAGNAPIKLTVITVIEVPDSRTAEKLLHDHFATKRLSRGEWFELDASDVELIKGFPKSFENLPPSPDIPF